MTKIFKIPVTWELCGIIEVEAASLNEALNKFDKDSDIYELPNKPQYIDGSFQRADEEVCKLENGIE